MFASLLAASLASNLGLVGCTLTDADMKFGRTPPRGSTSEALFASGLADGPTCAADVGLLRGSSPAAGPVSGGAGTRGVLGVIGDAIAGDAGAAPRGLGEMNIDLVPSTKRPPRGGPLLAGIVGCVIDRVGGFEDGPAPGDCSGPCGPTLCCTADGGGLWMEGDGGRPR